MDFENVKFFFLNRTQGESEKGAWYKLTIAIDSVSNGKSNTFSSDFFVDPVMYAKTENFEKFGQVDAIFLPSAKGFARLVSIEEL